LPLRRGRYRGRLHRSCFETTPGSFNFSLGCALASRPRLGGRRGVVSDVVSHDRARSAINESGLLAGFRLRSEPQANRSDAYPARPMTVFDIEVIVWHRPPPTEQCLIPASVPPATIVGGNVKSLRVSDIDHRVVMPSRHATSPGHRHPSAIERVWRRFRLIPPEESLPNPQTHTLSPRAAARPRCPKCHAHGDPAHHRSSYRFRALTLRCIKCGLIH
jgi:hypothetical protein